MNLQAPSSVETDSPSAATPARCILARTLARIQREDSGQDLIEYALAAALIGLTAVSSMNGLAVSISNSLDSVGSAVTNAVPSISTAPSSGGSGGSGGFGDHHDHH